MSVEKARSEMVYMHEIGHALIAFLLGIRIISIDLKIDSVDLPETRISTSDFNNLEVENKLLFYMGGYAAEKLYVDLVSRNPEHSAYPYVNNIFTSDIENSIESDIKSTQAITGTLDIELIDVAKSSALEMLRSNSPLIGRLFKELSERGGVMTGEEFVEICS
jgi:hypothetical protein